jgi:bifunctional non-homologous end joining protein LigD
MRTAQTLSERSRYASSMRNGLRPMPLIRVADSFDDVDWVFELKHDGFRALAHVERHQGTLVSRRGHIYRQWPMLETEIAYAVRPMSCVLDGEIVALAPDGRSKFYDLMFRREWPHFIAFDVLFIDGEDLRERPLVERKRRLRRIMPRPEVHARLLYHAHIAGRGRAVRRGARERFGGRCRQVEAWTLPLRRADDVAVQDQERRLLADRGAP